MNPAYLNSSRAGINFSTYPSPTTDKLFADSLTDKFFASLLFIELDLEDNYSFTSPKLLKVLIIALRMGAVT